jgi:hypothetical protein
MQARESRVEAARLRAAFERASTRRGRGLSQVEKAVLMYLRHAMKQRPRSRKSR